MKNRRMLFILLSLSMCFLFIGCNKPEPYLTTGYVESMLFYLASPIGGNLENLPVHEGQMVKKGQELATIKNQSALTAPAAAQIVEFFYQKDEYVPPASPIMSLFIPAKMKIVFYVPEQNLNQISIGKEITVKALNNQFKAKINYIGKQAEYTPDALFSGTNRYKLIYKVKANIPDQQIKLIKIGQPVDINYE